jgi:hypothetical protein
MANSPPKLIETPLFASVRTAGDFFSGYQEKQPSW